MLEKHGIACDLMHGFDRSDWSGRRVGGPGLHRVGGVPSRGGSHNAARLLQLIPAELITQVRKSVTIDWTLWESARARIKVMVKRILNKHGYPPDLQEEAVKTVLMQAELLCADWV